MGHNIQMLAERRGMPGLDHGGSLNLEIEECFHFHLEDLRIVLNKSDFVNMAETFALALKFHEELGSPEDTGLRHYTLSGRPLPGKRLQNDRMAIELTKDGTVHFHNKCLRIHMTQPDFWEMADMCEEAKYSLMRENLTKIKLDDPNVSISGSVPDLTAWLNEYKSGEGRPAKAIDVKELAQKVRWYLTHYKGDATTEDDLQRPLGNLPSDWKTGEIPEDLNKKYLFSLYHSIQEWGYAEGPFFGEYMQAFNLDNGKIYLKGAHRVTCLKALGINEIDVYLTAPPSV